MARKALIHPVDALSEKNPKAYKDHGSTIRSLIGAEGMRVIGRAYDKGIIIKEA